MQCLLLLLVLLAGVVVVVVVNDPCSSLIIGIGGVGILILHSIQCNVIYLG